MSLALFSPIHAAAAPTRLPELPGWRGELLGVTPLNPADEDLGYWERWSYRSTATTDRLEVSLLRGPAAGTLYVPKIGGTRDDLPIGFGSQYETLVIEGRPAVMETHPYLGLALAVQADRDVTLTLESRSLTRQQLIETAGLLIASQIEVEGLKPEK
jgi:hypothetical protein